MAVVRRLAGLAMLIALVSTPARALAQVPAQPPTPVPAPPPAAPPPSQPEQISDSLMRIGASHYIRQGRVEIHDVKTKTDIYADMVEFFEDEDRAVATGNFVMSQGTNRISAERAEFNTKSGLGTFYNASGIATVQPPRQQNRPGAFAPPPIAGQETMVYFFGETVEKIGPKKYKISKGGFSTCVQPTPRWEMSANTVVLNVDHYTLLRNAVMTVKGVPMLYLPVLYYPTKKEDRATGILLPTYGVSSYRGQTIHNGFFWAINRSQDATLMHDWYSKTGQGIGGEYRYNYGAAADGYLGTHFLDQKAATYVLPSGGTTESPAGHEFEIRGSANQLLPAHLRARGAIDYFSSLQTSQSFNTDINNISRNSRRYGGNIVGSWSSYSLNATLDHSEYFYSADESILSGTWPKVALSRNERPIAGTPFYFSVGGEYARQLRQQRFRDGDEVAQTDSTLDRFDVSPQVRFPFKKWQWFTVNTSASVRDTYYTRSLKPTGDPAVAPSEVVDQPLNRPVFSVQSQILGPVFNRIWDTPGNGYAEKFKHSVEPFLTVTKTANVENYDRVVQFDGIDYYTGGTQYNYGLSNRFYAKRKIQPGQQAQAREIIAVELSQTYYTNQFAAARDRSYQTTALGDTQPSNFSPIALSVRALPTNELNATVRAEFDARYHELRTISASATYSLGSRLQTQAGWSKRAFIAELIGFNDKSFLDHFINGSSTFRTSDSKYGASYSFNYDVLNSSMLQQRITGFYNAQCCGIAMEYQALNYGSFYSVLPSDHRFFLSFTLAGLGNFSPFNGAMSGVPR